MSDNSREFLFATVGAVTTNGVTLIFPGETSPTAKEYPCNSGALLKPGDRVKVCPDSGTHVVEYALGAPGSRLLVPPGGTQGQALIKASDDDYALQWSSPSAGSTDRLYVTDDNYVQLDADGNLIPCTPAVSHNFSLGASGHRWNSLWLGTGYMYMGTSTSRLGFFGTVPIARQALSNSATLAQVITALKAYGLFS